MDKDNSQEKRFHGEPKAVNSCYKLRIKLNLRGLNTEPVDAKGDKSPLKKQGSFSHHCNICNKDFSSRKAIGGHMRVHYQANKRVISHSCSIKKTKDEDFCNNIDENTENPLCSICSKKFLSLKALYGHMRSHPERSWRGIQPPFQKPHSSINSSVNSSVDSSVDSSRFLPTWSITAKRGRNRIAQNLMTITSSEDFDQKKRRFDAIEGNSDEGMAKNAVLKTGKVDSDLESRVSVKKYKCNLCSKAFLTHQALGGHKSSHNKPKKEGGSSMQKLEGIMDMKFITGRRILDFDLNELPKMEEEEGEGDEFCFFNQSLAKS